MKTEILETEQKHVIETEISPLLSKASSLVVKSHDDRFSAVSFIKSLKEMKDRIEERFHPTRNKQAAYKAYEVALETEKSFYSPIDEAVKISNAAVKTFDTNEAIRVMREAREAEAKRQESERKEREKLEEQARKAEEKGKVEKAEVLREQAQSVTVAPSFTPTPVSTKKLIWKCKVTNLFFLCKAIASGQVPFSVVEVRASALNDFAKNHDGKTKIEGLEFYQESNGRI